MGTRTLRRFGGTLPATILAAALAACGGGGSGGGDTDPQQPLPGIYVDAEDGSDAAGDGSFENPFKTITRALFDAGAGDVVRVGPGTYDAANGEVFPIQPGIGVTIQGSELRSPLGVRRFTNIVGGQFWLGDPAGELHAAVVPRANSRLAGLNIRDPEPLSATTNPAAVLIASVGVTVESCSLLDSGSGVFLVDGATGASIEDCLVETNNVGIQVDGPGSGSLNRVEGCLVVDNVWGVWCHTRGIDFGGGPAGSPGFNAFTSSSWNDVVHDAPGASIHATNCFWDHAPPTLHQDPITDDVSDVWEQWSGNVVVTTGAQVYESDSPVPGGDVLEP
jgi:hypothetical protein